MIMLSWPVETPTTATVTQVGVSTDQGGPPLMLSAAGINSNTSVFFLYCSKQGYVKTKTILLIFFLIPFPPFF